MIPRPVVTLVVLVSLAIVAADVGYQFVPGSGHTANPLIDGPLIALIAATITGAKGPKPEAPPAPSAPPAPLSSVPPPTPEYPVERSRSGRHYYRSEGP